MTQDDVYAIRKELGLTWIQFAEAMQVDVRTVARWESGSASPGGPATWRLYQLIKMHRAKSVNAKQEPAQTTAGR